MVHAVLRCNPWAWTNHSWPSRSGSRGFGFNTSRGVTGCSGFPALIACCLLLDDGKSQCENGVLAFRLAHHWWCSNLPGISPTLSQCTGHAADDEESQYLPGRFLTVSKNVALHWSLAACGGTYIWSLGSRPPATELRAMKFTQNGSRSSNADYLPRKCQSVV